MDDSLDDRCKTWTSYVKKMDDSLDGSCKTWNVFLDCLVSKELKINLNWGPVFADFPIQMAKKGEKQPNFDESYLSNRLGLENK